MDLVVLFISAPRCTQSEGIKSGLYYNANNITKYPILVLLWEISPTSMLELVLLMCVNRETMLYLVLIYKIHTYLLLTNENEMKQFIARNRYIHTSIYSLISAQ